MQFGVFLITAQPPGMTAAESIAASCAYAEAAERLGYDHAWVLEHHFTRYGLVGSALAQAAFILGRTTRLRVGTAINVIPLGHPIRLAEEVALIDQLSQGRLMFGIGRGTFVKDYTVFGVDMSDNRAILTEWYDVISRCWREGRCSADSERLRFSEVEVFPPVYSQPGPPVYAVAQSPETVKWAAARGIPMILNFTLTDEEKLALIEEYEACAEDAGIDPTDVPHLLSCLAGTAGDGDTIRNRSRDYFVWWLEEFARASRLFEAENEHIAGYEQHRRKWAEMIQRGERNASQSVGRIYAVNPIGSPQECIDRLAQTIRKTGIRNYAFGFEAAGDRGAVLDSMQMFSEEVLGPIAAADSPRTVASSA